MLRTNSIEKDKLPNIEKPPRPLGTPPKEGKLGDFPSVEKSLNLLILNLMTLL